MKRAVTSSRLAIPSSCLCRASQSNACPGTVNQSNSMSPLQKGYVTAEAQRSQRKTLSRVTPTYAAPCIMVRVQGSLRPRRLSGACLQRRHSIQTGAGCHSPARVLLTASAPIRCEPCPSALCPNLNLDLREHPESFLSERAIRKPDLWYHDGDYAVLIRSNLVCHDVRFDPIQRSMQPI